MANPTFSRWDRVSRCIGSAVLPQKADEPGPYAQRGTELHRLRQVAITDGFAVAREQCDPDLQDDLIAILDEGWPDGARAEVAYAYDVATDTARELQIDAARAYPDDLGPFEIVGTVDLVAPAVTPGGDPTVAAEDLKTGRGWQPPVRDHWQARLGALATSRASQARGAWVSLMAPMGRGYRRDSVYLDDLDLDIFADDLRARLKALHLARAGYVGGAMPQLDEGPWCSYCAAFDACPLKRAHVAAMASTESILPDVADDTIAAVWRAVESLPEVIKRARQAIREHVAQSGPVDLGDGTELVEVEKRKPERIVPEVLREIYPDAVEVVEVLRGSKSSIEAALRNDGSGEPVAPRARAILEQLREAGGTKQSTYLDVAVRERPAPSLKLINGGG